MVYPFEQTPTVLKVADVNYDSKADLVVGFESGSFAIMQADATAEGCFLLQVSAGDVVLNEKGALAHLEVGELDVGNDTLEIVRSTFIPQENLADDQISAMIEILSWDNENTIDLTWADRIYKKWQRRLLSVTLMATGTTIWCMSCRG